MEAHNKLDETDTRERVVKVNARGEIQWDYALEEKEEKGEEKPEPGADTEVHFLGLLRGGDLSSADGPG